MAERQQNAYGFQPPAFDQGRGQQYGMGPVSAQPGPLGGGPAGPGAGVPPGLAYLAQVDQLLVQQKVEMLEVFSGFETQNKYTVKNSMGQRVFFVAEQSDCCTRQCCGPIRPFDMKIMDETQREVIHLSRPLNGQGCCCPCCLQELEVIVDGQPIGRVKEQWTFLYPKLTVHRPDGTHVLTIGGQLCPCSCCDDVVFPVYTADGSREVGRITKHWTGFCKEAFTDADNMSVTFPMDLETNMKATLLGALFLVEFMFFERSN